MNEQELLRYYEQELTHLRKMGVEFARSYPKVAGRLELSHEGCADPYVERLIESFAFLTARIRHNMESQFPEIPSALLGVLYPHLIAPVPSMSVARFEADPLQGMLTSGYTIAKHTPLFATAGGGETLRFRTCYPVTLWPLEVTSAAYETPERFDTLGLPFSADSAIHLRIERRGGPLAELGLKRLRFYLNGEPMLVHSIYRLLFEKEARVAIIPDQSSRPVILPERSLRPVGFDTGEEALPCPRQSHPQYRLLQEYFSFPEKFLFIDVENLDRHGSERGFDLYFFFEGKPAVRPAVGPGTFALGCTPIINLFRKTSEPIRLSHTQTEYPLLPDMRREATTEIHTIERVTISSDAGDETDTVEPFFSYSHRSAERAAAAYWYARRRPTGRRDIPGTEVLLSLVDLAFKPSLPPAQTIFAHTLCTNRHAAAGLPSGGALQMETAAPVAAIELLRKPTRQIDSPLSGMAYWRLVSHLSLNHLSLSDSDDEESLRALREILLLYAHADEPSHHHQIMGLRGMACRRVTRRMGRDAWRGFCRGTGITLSFDETKYVGGSPFLFASVLDRFFALYTSINSFTQLSARGVQREQIWKQWPPMVGEQSIL